MPPKPQIPQPTSHSRISIPQQPHARTHGQPKSHHTLYTLHECSPQPAYTLIHCICHDSASAAGGKPRQRLRQQPRQPPPPVRIRTARHHTARARAAARGAARFMQRCATAADTLCVCHDCTLHPAAPCSCCCCRNGCWVRSGRRMRLQDCTLPRLHCRMACAPSNAPPSPVLPAPGGAGPCCHHAAPPAACAAGGPEPTACSAAT